MLDSQNIEINKQIEQNTINQENTNLEIYIQQLLEQYMINKRSVLLQLITYIQSDIIKKQHLNHYLFIQQLLNDLTDSKIQDLVLLLLYLIKQDNNQNISTSLNAILALQNPLPLLWLDNQIYTFYWSYPNQIYQMIHGPDNICNQHCVNILECENTLNQSVLGKLIIKAVKKYLNVGIFEDIQNKITNNQKLSDNELFVLLNLLNTNTSDLRIIQFFLNRNHIDEIDSILKLKPELIYYIKIQDENLYQQLINQSVRLKLYQYEQNCALLQEQKIEMQQEKIILNNSIQDLAYFTKIIYEQDSQEMIDKLINNVKIVNVDALNIVLYLLIFDKIKLSTEKLTELQKSQYLSNYIAVYGTFVQNQYPIDETQDDSFDIIETDEPIKQVQITKEFLLKCLQIPSNQELLSSGLYNILVQSLNSVNKEQYEEIHDILVNILLTNTGKLNIPILLTSSQLFQSILLSYIEKFTTESVQLTILQLFYQCNTTIIELYLSTNNMISSLIRKIINKEIFTFTKNELDIQVSLIQYPLKLRQFYSDQIMHKDNQMQNKIYDLNLTKTQTLVCYSLLNQYLNEQLEIDQTLSYSLLCQPQSYEEIIDQFIFFNLIQQNQILINEEIYQKFLQQRHFTFKSNFNALLYLQRLKMLMLQLDSFDQIQNDFQEILKSFIDTKFETQYQKILQQTLIEISIIYIQKCRNIEKTFILLLSKLINRNIEQFKVDRLIRIFQESNKRQFYVQLDIRQYFDYLIQNLKQLNSDDQKVLVIQLLYQDKQQIQDQIDLFIYFIQFLTQNNLLGIHYRLISQIICKIDKMTQLEQIYQILLKQISLQYQNIDCQILQKIFILQIDQFKDQQSQQYIIQKLKESLQDNFNWEFIIQIIQFEQSNNFNIISQLFDQKLINIAIQNYKLQYSKQMLFIFEKTNFDIKNLYILAQILINDQTTQSSLFLLYQILYKIQQQTNINSSKNFDKLNNKEVFYLRLIASYDKLEQQQQTLIILILTLLNNEFICQQDEAIQFCKKIKQLICDKIKIYDKLSQFDIAHIAYIFDFINYSKDSIVPSLLSSNLMKYKEIIIQ